MERFFIRKKAEELVEPIKLIGPKSIDKDNEKSIISHKINSSGEIYIVAVIIAHFFTCCRELAFILDKLLNTSIACEILDCNWIKFAWRHTAGIPEKKCGIC